MTHNLTKHESDSKFNKISGAKNAEPQFFLNDHQNYKIGTVMRANLEHLSQVVGKILKLY